jgi:hypothetical protein
MDIIKLLLDNKEIILSIIFAVGIFEVFKRLLKQYQLREPVRMHFYIPKKEHIRLNYVKQTDTDHLVDELVLPSNKNCLIMIWYKAKLNYHEDSKYINFRKGEYDVKPSTIKWFNPFIKKGTNRICSPKDNKNHYLDWWGAYHINSDRNFNKDEVYTGGFIVKTPNIEGEFNLVTSIHTSTRLGNKILKVKIQNKPFKEKIFCIGYTENRLFHSKNIWHKKHALVFSSNNKS